MVLEQAPLTNCNGHCNNAYPFNEAHFRLLDGALTQPCNWCNTRGAEHTRAITREIMLQLNIETRTDYDELPQEDRTRYHREIREQRNNSGLTNHEFYMVHLAEHDLPLPDYMDRDESHGLQPWHYYTNWLDINGNPICEAFDVIDPCPACGLLHLGPGEAPVEAGGEAQALAQQHVEQAQEGNVVIPRPPREVQARVANYARNGPIIRARELRSYLAVEEYLNGFEFESHEVHTPVLVRRFNENYAEIFEQVDAFPGYDVWSYHEEHHARYIEVKSVLGTGRSVLISINELRHALENPETYRLAIVRFVEGDVTRHEDEGGNVTYTGHNGAVQVYSWRGDESEELLAIITRIGEEFGDSARAISWELQVPGGLLEPIDF